MKIHIKNTINNKAKKQNTRYNTKSGNNATQPITQQRRWKARNV